MLWFLQACQVHGARALVVSGLESVMLTVWPLWDHMHWSDSNRTMHPRWLHCCCICALNCMRTHPAGYQRADQHSHAVRQTACANATAASDAMALLSHFACFYDADMHSANSQPLNGIHSSTRVLPTASVPHHTFKTELHAWHLITAPAETQHQPQQLPRSPPRRQQSLTVLLHSFECR